MENIYEFIQINALCTSLKAQDIDIDKIYMSIGSKWNQHVVDFGVKSKDQVHYSNSIYQMVPSFMRVPQHGKQNIIIIVDDFHRTESIEVNQEILKRDLNGNLIQNLKVIFVDSYVISSQIYKLLKPFFEFIRYKKLSQSQVKLVNFISFQHPNDREYNIEKELPDAIEEYLKSNSPDFIDCYYQWFGYLFYYYDYIFPYSTYKFLYLRNIRLLQNQLFEKTLHSTRLDPFEYDAIDDFLIKNHKKDIQLLRIWEDFKKQTIHLLHSFDAQSLQR